MAVTISLALGLGLAMCKLIHTHEIMYNSDLILSINKGANMQGSSISV